jgi:hypothetical protein
MIYRNNRNKFLFDEAAAITVDLDDVTFIGAIAVFMHTKQGRESRDLDFSIAYDITDEQLREKGYIKHGNGRNGYTSPRNIIVDIYRNDPINRIPIKTITDTATEFPSKRRRPKMVKAVNLEVLIIMKFRSRGSKHAHDLHLLALTKYGEIRWKDLENIISDESEFKQIKATIEALHKIPLN